MFTDFKMLISKGSANCSCLDGDGQNMQLFFHVCFFAANSLLAGCHGYGHRFGHRWLLTSLHHMDRALASQAKAERAPRQGVGSSVQVLHSYG